MSDENINFNLSVKTSDFVEKVSELVKEVERLTTQTNEATVFMQKLQEQIKITALSSKKSFREAVVVLKKDFADFAMSFQKAYLNLPEIKMRTDYADVEKDINSKRLQAVNEYNSSISRAYSNVIEEEKREAKEQADFEAGLQKNLTAIKKQATEEDMRLSKQRADYERKVANEIIKNNNKLASSLSAIGKIGQFVFGTVLGLSAVTVLRDIVRWFQEAMQAGVEFSQSLYKLTVSVHAMQRVGMDVTMKETAQLVKELGDQYEFFTTRQIVDGVAYVQLLTRNFGFTEKQMQDVFKISATLATVLGKDFNTAARETALFLSSGYAESMQRAGLAVNRLTVTQEAHRMGIKKSYMAMTEQERSAAALNLVMREMGPLFEDVGKYAETSAGKIAIAQADIQEMKDTIGLETAPILADFYKLWAGILQTWMNVAGKISEVSKMLAQYFILPFKLAEEAQKKWEQKTSYIGDVMENAVKATEEATKDWKIYASLSPEELEGLLGADETANAAARLQQEEEDRQEKEADLLRKMYLDTQKLNEDYKKESLELEQEYNKDIEELNKEHQEEMADIDEKGREKRLEIAEEFAERMAEIEQDMLYEIEDENRDYQRELQELAIDERQEMQDAQKKYREEELKAERDYQDKLRRLREEYLFDLEDALRERDALQVLRLMRKYEMDKNNLQREMETEKQERADDLQNELAEIKEDADNKRAELAREHQQRLEDIQIQAERERLEAEENRKKALEELEADLAAQRAAEQANYDEKKAMREEEYRIEQEELQANFDERLAKIITGLAEEEDITNESLDRLAQAYKETVGKNGAIGRSYDEFIDIVENATEIAQSNLRDIQQTVEEMQRLAEEANIAYQETLSAQQAQQALETAGAGTPPPAPLVGGHAFGGMEYANKPTLAMYGEAGPEIANFIPISRLNTNNLGLPSPYFGDTISGKMAGGTSGKVRIELAPGLVASIVDGALDQVADIYYAGR